MIYCGQKYPLSFHVFMKGLFLQKKNLRVFCQNEIKIDEGLFPKFGAYTLFFVHKSEVNKENMRNMFAL